MPKGKKELQFLELVNSELIDSYYWFYNKDEFGIEIKYENIFEFIIFMARILSLLKWGGIAICVSSYPLPGTPPIIILSILSLVHVL